MIQNLTAVCDANPSCRGVEWMACEDGYYGGINYTYVNSPVHCVSVAYQKNHAKKSGVSLLTVVLFMLVASGIAAAQNSTLVMSNATALDVFHTTNDTFFNEIVPDFGAAPGLYVCDDTPDVYEILPINATRAFTKRQMPANMFFVQYQIYGHGEWWSNWKRISGCIEGSLGSGGTYSIATAESFSYTLSGNIGIQTIKELISNQLSIGVSQTWTHTETRTCTLPSNTDAVCIWSQHRYLWTDTHVRTCSRMPPLTCTAWGDDTHADTPENDYTARNYGCSTGLGNCGYCR